MPERFLSSEEYDERAHHLYNEGDYDGALEMLKEGLALYPNSVELYVGLGYARLAREEYAWARQAFEHAMVLDAGHEDAMVGMGEVLLRLGKAEEALHLFGEVKAMGYEDDLELMLTMGRALYREGLYREARDVFAKIATARPESAEAIAAVGYVLLRLGDEVGACRQIRRALRLDPDLHDARVYLGHILYDRGDWDGALREFEQVPPQDHWDALAVWRLVELKRAIWRLAEDDSRLLPWSKRLADLEALEDPIDRLLAEVEARAAGEGVRTFADKNQLELFGLGSEGETVRQVRLLDGHSLRGTAQEIVCQMRDQAGFSHETMSQYMRRLAERWHEQFGVEVPFSDPEAFLRGAVLQGLVRLEES